MRQENAKRARRAFIEQSEARWDERRGRVLRYIRQNPGCTAWDIVDNAFVRSIFTYEQVTFVLRKLLAEGVLMRTKESIKTGNYQNRWFIVKV